MKKQDRKQNYSAVISLMLQAKHKEAFDAITLMCGQDTGLFIMADYDEQMKKLTQQDT